jgi:uncharacterized protein (TIGR02118 family)
MIRVSVFYAKSDDATFDLDYYKNTHMAIVRESFPDLERIEVDNGLDGAFVAAGHLYFPTMEAMQASMGGPGAGAAMADVPNFTNITPSIQVSEIVL